MGIPFSVLTQGSTLHINSQAKLSLKPMDLFGWFFQLQIQLAGSLSVLCHDPCLSLYPEHVISYYD